MKDSLFKSAIRSLLITFGAFLGFGLGLIFILLFFSGLSDDTSKLKIETSYKPLIMPNAKGIRKEMDKSVPVILQLDISGIIGSEFLNEKTVRQQLIESREGELKNERVKAILLTIRSPGGTVDDADSIYQALKNYKSEYKVPIYAFVDGMCASGGFYVACAADKIYARDSSLIGSIGVILSPFINVSQLIEKIGVSSMTLFAGKGKDSMNPLRPWKEGEQANLQNIINEYYTRFVNLVIQNRPNVNREQLVDHYGADIYLSDEAAKKGMIDFPDSSESQVISELATAIGASNDSYQVVSLSKKSWLTELFSEKNGLSSFSSHHHHIDLGDGIPNELRGKLLYLYRKD